MSEALRVIAERDATIARLWAAYDALKAWVAAVEYYTADGAIRSGVSDEDKARIRPLVQARDATAAALTLADRVTGDKKVEET